MISKGDTQAGWHKILGRPPFLEPNLESNMADDCYKCTLTTCDCSFLSVSFCVCTCALLVLSWFTRAMQAQEKGNWSIFLGLCLCLRLCVARVYQDSTSSNKHKAVMLPSHQFTR